MSAGSDAKTKNRRPDIASTRSGVELKNWYWLKTEIVDYARALGVSPTGGKFEVIDRIAVYLDSGKKEKPKSRVKQSAGYDWHDAKIVPTTLITENYLNTSNVREFFIGQIGKRFSFNISFMAWMKANAGKTMADAVDEWLRLEAEKKAGKKPDIPFHNQFNAYVQAFFADNPGRSMDEARYFWKLKRNLPGHNRYEHSDLDLKE